jgi:hypothetical protein
MLESDVCKSCSKHARVRNANKVLGKNLERSKTLGRSKCGWKDAIKIDFKEIIWQHLYWVCLP